MRRRDLIALVGAMAAWPMTARAQRSRIPTIGFLQVGTPDSFATETIAFRKGLAQSGYVEGRDVVIEYR